MSGRTNLNSGKCASINKTVVVRCVFGLLLIITLYFRYISRAVESVQQFNSGRLTNSRRIRIASIVLLITAVVVNLLLIGLLVGLLTTRSTSEHHDTDSQTPEQTQSEFAVYGVPYLYRHNVSMRSPVGYVNEASSDINSHRALDALLVVTACQCCSCVRGALGAKRFEAYRRRMITKTAHDVHMLLTTRHYFSHMGYFVGIVAMWR